MNKSLTICYITSREQPRIEWFFESLKRQIGPKDDVRVIVVDALRDQEYRSTDSNGIDAKFVAPKPTIWQGKHRIVSEDWWAASNARNTGICLCQTEWIAFLDDRSVLLPNWLNCVNAAMANGYAVCGSYEKVYDLVVENGEVKAYKEPPDSGKDARLNHPDLFRSAANMAPGEWWFGCCNAVPLEWALAINGYDETCDGISMEDCIFGLMLKNNGWPVCFDPRMKILEDRTNGELGRPMRREDKGVSPNDKSHAMLAMLRGRKKALHRWELAGIREKVLQGGSFPTPPKQVYTDWFDGETIDRDYTRKK